MIHRRDPFDPLTPSPKPRWLLVWDMQFNLLDSTELAPLSDLKTVMAQTARDWRSQGWSVESDARFGSFFCHRNGTRRLIAITAADPSQRSGGGPSWHDSCPTCGE